MVRFLHLELLIETLRAVSKSTTQLCSRIWYLETQTVHHFAALPAWLAEDVTVYRGDNQDPAFTEKIRKLISQRPDWPRHILNDDGHFKVI
jgi:hypothetical protein